MTPTALENWLQARLRRRRRSLAELEAHQLDRLNETLAHVLQHSPFYRRRMPADRRPPLTDLRQTADLPFTTADDLRRHHLDMLCVSHGDVARVATLKTSGTTAAPKRIYFSVDDLESTVDFFHHGMGCVVAPGERVLILHPGAAPDDVGDPLRWDASGMVKRTIAAV